MKNSLKHQNGSALVVALIFLGVLTMVGVSVTLSSTSQLKIASNSEEMNDTLHATNAGANMLASKTILNAETPNHSDELLKAAAQSVNNREQSTISTYGNDKNITILIKQKARGAICPRAVAGSSVTKIACDHFTITSVSPGQSEFDQALDKFIKIDGNGNRITDDNGEPVEDKYNPSTVVGVYREMIHSDSATHKALDISGS